MNILNEDKWGDLECLCKACQAAVTNIGFFRDTGVNERGVSEVRMNDIVKMTGMKTVSHVKGPENRQE